MGDILELLVDKGLASRYHWYHCLNNFLVGGKRETLTLSQSHCGLAEYQSSQQGTQTTAGALGPPFLEIQVLMTILKIGANSQRALQ